MDTITHGIVGALAGKAFFAGGDVPARPRNTQSSSADDPVARAGIAACTIGAMFPDIDVFAGPIAGNPLAIMEWHRNISHSLVLLPVWALLLAALSIPTLRWLGWKAPSFAQLAGIYAFGLLTHVFLDVVTNFGTMVRSPLQYSRVAWDWVYIVDLTLTGLALLPQLAAWCYRDPGKFRLRAVAICTILALAAFGAHALAASVAAPFPLWVVAVVAAVVAAIIFTPAMGTIGFGWRRASWCRAGFALVCMYVGIAGAAHHRALVYAKDFAAAQHLQANSVAALAIPPAMTHWAAVVSTPNGVWRRTFHVPGEVVERTEFFRDERSDPYVQEAMKLRDVQVYLWFARFPVWKVFQRDGQTVAEVSDVRFFRLNRDETVDSPERSSKQQEAGFLKARRGSNGFAFDVVFDAEGRVLSSGFRKNEP